MLYAICSSATSTGISEDEVCYSVRNYHQARCKKTKLGVKKKEQVNLAVNTLTLSNKSKRNVGVSAAATPLY